MKHLYTISGSFYDKSPLKIKLCFICDMKINCKIIIKSETTQRPTVVIARDRIANFHYNLLLKSSVLCYYLLLTILYYIFSLTIFIYEIFVVIYYYYHQEHTGILTNRSWNYIL